MPVAEAEDVLVEGRFGADGMPHNHKPGVFRIAYNPEMLRWYRLEDDAPFDKEQIIVAEDDGGNTKLALTSGGQGFLWEKDLARDGDTNLPTGEVQTHSYIYEVYVNGKLFVPGQEIVAPEKPKRIRAKRPAKVDLDEPEEVPQTPPKRAKADDTVKFKLYRQSRRNSLIRAEDTYEMTKDELRKFFSDKAMFPRHTTLTLAGQHEPIKVTTVTVVNLLMDRRHLDAAANRIHAEIPGLTLEAVGMTEEDLARRKRESKNQKRREQNVQKALERKKLTEGTTSESSPTEPKSSEPEKKAKRKRKKAVEDDVGPVEVSFVHAVTETPIRKYEISPEEDVPLYDFPDGSRFFYMGKGTTKESSELTQMVPRNIFPKIFGKAKVRVIYVLPPLRVMLPVTVNEKVAVATFQEGSEEEEKEEVSRTFFDAQRALLSVMTLTQLKARKEVATVFRSVNGFLKEVQTDGDFAALFVHGLSDDVGTSMRHAFSVESTQLLNVPLVYLNCAAAMEQTKGRIHVRRWPDEVVQILRDLKSTNVPVRQMDVVEVPPRADADADEDDPVQVDYERHRSRIATRALRTIQAMAAQIAAGGSGDVSVKQAIAEAAEIELSGDGKPLDEEMQEIVAEDVGLRATVATAAITTGSVTIEDALSEMEYQDTEVRAFEKAAEEFLFTGVSKTLDVTQTRARDMYDFIRASALRYMAEADLHAVGRPGATAVVYAAGEGRVTKIVDIRNSLNTQQLEREVFILGVLKKVFQGDGDGDFFPEVFAQISEAEAGYALITMSRFVLGDAVRVFGVKPQGNTLVDYVTCLYDDSRTVDDVYAYLRKTFTALNLIAAAAYMIIAALVHRHIVHGDFQPQNLLLHTVGNVTKLKLIDYGASMQYDEVTGLALQEQIVPTLLKFSQYYDLVVFYTAMQKLCRPLMSRFAERHKLSLSEIASLWDEFDLHHGWVDKVDLARLLDAFTVSSETIDRAMKESSNASMSITVGLKLLGVMEGGMKEGVVDQSGRKGLVVKTWLNDGRIDAARAMLRSDIWQEGDFVLKNYTDVQVFFHLIPEERLPKAVRDLDAAQRPFIETALALVLVQERYKEILENGIDDRLPIEFAGLEKTDSLAEIAEKLEAGMETMSDVEYEAVLQVVHDKVFLFEYLLERFFGATVGYFTRTASRILWELNVQKNSFYLKELTDEQVENLVGRTASDMSGDEGKRQTSYAVIIPDGSSLREYYTDVLYESQFGNLQKFMLWSEKLLAGEADIFASSSEAEDEMEGEAEEAEQEEEPEAPAMYAEDPVLEEMEEEEPEVEVERDRHGRVVSDTGPTTKVLVYVDDLPVVLVRGKAVLKLDATLAERLRVTPHLQNKYVLDIHRLLSELEEKMGGPLETSFVHDVVHGIVMEILTAEYNELHNVSDERGGSPVSSENESEEENVAEEGEDEQAVAPRSSSSSSSSDLDSEGEDISPDASEGELDMDVGGKMSDSSSEYSSTDDELDEEAKVLKAEKKKLKKEEKKLKKLAKKSKKRKALAKKNVQKSGDEDEPVIIAPPATTPLERSKRVLDLTRMPAAKDESEEEEEEEDVPEENLLMDVEDGADEKAPITYLVEIMDHDLSRSFEILLKRLLQSNEWLQAMERFDMSPDAEFTPLFQEWLKSAFPNHSRGLMAKELLASTQKRGTGRLEGILGYYLSVFDAAEMDVGAHVNELNQRLGGDGEEGKTEMYMVMVSRGFISPFVREQYEDFLGNVPAPRHKNIYDRWRRIFGFDFEYALQAYVAGGRRRNMDAETALEVAYYKSFLTEEKKNAVVSAEQINAIKVHVSHVFPPKNLAALEKMYGLEMALLRLSKDAKNKSLTMVNLVENIAILRTSGPPVIKKKEKPESEEWLRQHYRDPGIWTVEKPKRWTQNRKTYLTSCGLWISADAVVQAGLTLVDEVPFMTGAADVPVDVFRYGAAAKRYAPSRKVALIVDVDERKEAEERERAAYEAEMARLRAKEDVEETKRNTPIEPRQWRPSSEVSKSEENHLHKFLHTLGIKAFPLFTFGALPFFVSQKRKELEVSSAQAAENWKAEERATGLVTLQEIINYVEMVYPAVPRPKELAEAIPQMKAFIQKGVLKEE